MLFSFDFLLLILERPQVNHVDKNFGNNNMLTIKIGTKLDQAEKAGSTYIPKRSDRSWSGPSSVHNGLSASQMGRRLNILA